MPHEQGRDLGKEVSKVEITNLTPDDWEIYKNLRIKAVEQDPTAFFDKPEDLAHIPEEQWRKDMMGREAVNYSLLFAKSEGKFVGMVGIEYNKGEKREHVSTIQKLSVDKEKRGLGIGRKLMEAAMAEIEQVYKKKGKDRHYKIRIFVMDKPEAPIAMYEKFGFKERGRLPDDVYYDGKYYDQVMMDKFL